MNLVQLAFCGLIGVAWTPLNLMAKDPKQNADYFVPTNDPALELFTHTRVTIKWKSLTPGQRIFSYDLPLELDGLGQDIFVKEVSPNYFVGDRASGICEFEKIESCKMTYKNLKNNFSAAKAEILSKYPDPIERQSRIELTHRFISDPEPIGVWTAKEPIHGIPDRFKNQK